MELLCWGDAFTQYRCLPAVMKVVIPGPGTVIITATVWHGTHCHPHTVQIDFLFLFSSRSHTGSCQQHPGGIILLVLPALCQTCPLQGPHFSLSPGPISSILVNRYGSRPVVILGGLLCGIGMVSAAFCTSIIQLYICVGFITGKKKASPFDSHLKFSSYGLDILLWAKGNGNLVA